ncbi:hypothetical protein Hdeb2414_s0015g00442481 [Helianthus debilis subsp. tardiflorus]
MSIVSGWHVGGLRVDGLKCATRTRPILLFVSKLSTLTRTHINSGRPEHDSFNPDFKCFISGCKSNMNSFLKMDSKLCVFRKNGKRRKKEL